MTTKQSTPEPQNIVKNLDEIIKQQEMILTLLTSSGSLTAATIKERAKATIFLVQAARNGEWANQALISEQAERIADLEKQVQNSTETQTIRSVIHLHDAKHESFEWCGDALDEIEEVLRKSESESDWVVLLWGVLRRWENDEKRGYEEVAFAYLNEVRAVLGMSPGTYPHTDEEDEPEEDE